MSKDERDFLEALRKNSIEASAEILAGVQRLKSMYDEMTDDGSGEPMPRPRIGDHFYQLAKFELEHASTLIKLGNSQAEMVFDHLRQMARRAQKSTAPVLELIPDGLANGHSRGRFEVKNPFEKEGDLRFDIAVFRKADGSETTLKPTVAGRGPATVIPPHGTLSIEVSVATQHETLFGDVKVLLVADVEKQIAHRVVKVRGAKA